MHREEEEDEDIKLESSYKANGANEFKRSEIELLDFSKDFYKVLLFIAFPCFYYLHS